MKVALVHDWLTGMRGGERVLEQMIELYPGAEIHTLLHIPGTVSETIEACPHDVHPTAPLCCDQVPLVPSRLPLGRRAALLERLRPSDLKQSLRCQICHHRINHTPSVLLPHTNALCLVSVRRLLQP